jgi:hypothetical protein
MNTVAFFLRKNRLGYEADHSSPTTAEIKNTWSYTTIPLMVLRRGG